MSQSDFDFLQKRIAKRFNKLADKLVETEVGSWLARRLVSVVLFFKKSSILESIKWMIMSDLIRRDQIEGWDFTIANADNQRKIAAELANAQYDARTPESIARCTKLPVQEVRSILAAFVAAKNHPYRAWTGDLGVDGKGELYTLHSREPSGVRKIPLIGNALMNFVSEPVVD
jgi:hypothetical protein